MGKRRGVQLQNINDRVPVGYPYVLETRLVWLGVKQALRKNLTQSRGEGRRLVKKSLTLRRPPKKQSQPKITSLADEYLVNFKRTKRAKFKSIQSSERVQLSG